MQTLDILLSGVAARHFHSEIANTLGTQPYRLLTPDDAGCGEAQIAFVSRDVTGRSTKHELTVETHRFYDTMLVAPHLRWVHAHSAGVDRPVYRPARTRAQSRIRRLPACSRSRGVCL